MTGAGPAGLILTPGAGARRDQPGLVAIDQAVTKVGMVVERVEFPGRAAGKHRAGGRLDGDDGDDLGPE